MMVNPPVHGDAYARARLLLAKRAGLLPPNAVISPGMGQATAMWRGISKNLAANARRAGYAQPLMWLREGAIRGSLPNRR